MKTGQKIFKRDTVTNVVHSYTIKLLVYRREDVTVASDGVTYRIEV